MAHSSKNYGEPFKHEPNYSGPTKLRSCTDWWCLVIFLLFLLFWIMLFVFVCKYGYPENLTSARDDNGKLCGISNVVSKKPYLFYFNILACNPVLKRIGGCSSPFVCVENCPTKTFSIKGLLSNAAFPNVTKGDIAKHIICKYDFTPDATNEEELKDAVDKENCANIYLSSRPVLGRCLPNFDEFDMDLLSKLRPDKSTISNVAFSIINSIFYLPGLYEILAEDLETIWIYLLGALIISMVLSLAWIILLGFFSAFFVYGSIFIVYALIGVGLFYSYRTYSYYSSPPYECSENAASDLEPSSSKCTTWLVIGISLAVVAGILLMILLFLRKRIALTIPLIKEGSKYIMSHVFTLAFPIVIFAMKATIIGLCGYYFVSAESLGATPNNDYTFDSKFLKAFCERHNASAMKFSEIYHTSEVVVMCWLESFGGKRVLLLLHLYNLFIFFWLMGFITGFNHLSLAGVFATHYWTFNKKKLPRMALLLSAYRVLRYHMGSLFLGSFLLAVFKFMRLMISMISKQTSKYDNAFFHTVKKLCACCLWLFEKFLQFLTKNAYIMMAVYGKNFCTSARTGFNLIMRNVLRVWVLTKILHFLLFMGKLVIVLLMGSITYFSLEGTIFKPAFVVRYTAFPIVLVVVSSYIVASIFFQVFQAAVDTLFLCFLEDCERNDGSSARPYYMPKNLMKILGKKNKFRDLPDEETDQQIKISSQKSKVLPPRQLRRSKNDDYSDDWTPYRETSKD